MQEDQRPDCGKALVPEALGNKVIHPFGDFLLHNVGTGDGIALATEEHFGRFPKPAAADGADRQPAADASALVRLTPKEKQQVLAFLRSL